jgi:hypothetical protein
MIALLYGRIEPSDRIGDGMTSGGWPAGGSDTGSDFRRSFVFPHR